MTNIPQRHLDALERAREAGRAANLIELPDVSVLALYSGKTVALQDADGNVTVIVPPPDLWFAIENQKQEKRPDHLINLADLSRFIPLPVDPRHAAILIDTETCDECSKSMIAKPASDSVLPFDYEKKLGEAGFVLYAGEYYDRDLCVECVRAGRAQCKCSLCGQFRPSNDIKFEFGKPAEYLCTHCYAVTPAKVWDGEVQRIEGEHRYDWE